MLQYKRTVLGFIGVGEIGLPAVDVAIDLQHKRKEPAQKATTYESCAHQAWSATPALSVRPTGVHIARKELQTFLTQAQNSGPE